LPLEAKSSEGAYFAFGSMKFRKCMFRLWKEAQTPNFLLACAKI
jgi:hypothetical protein